MTNSKNKPEKSKKLPSFGEVIVYGISFTMLGGVVTAVLYVLAEIPDRLFSMGVVPRLIGFTILGGLVFWAWYWIKNNILNDKYKDDL